MKLKNELQSTVDQQIDYTPKMIHHLLHGPSLTKKEYNNEQRLCWYPDESIEYKESFCYHFNFRSVLNKEVFKWTLTITAYEVYFILFPIYQDNKKYKTLLNNTTHLYSFYESLYNEPSIRLKILSEFGPKISFSDFEKRKKAKETWK
jgi:hypothetical protein